jgi:glucosylceramidase
MATAPITWIVTTQHEPWRAASAPVFGDVTKMPSVFVELDRPQQEIEGFGASFNELGWTSLAHLSETDRDTVLRALFEPGVGTNFTRCRMPLGANDFSTDWYSYDETPGDLALDDFSIAHDQATLVPFIRAAQALQPGLTLWASPWSPPTWMKANGHYAGAKANPLVSDVENGIRDDQLGAEGTDMMRLDDETLAAYARYFGKFVDAYAGEGVPVTMVMPQNEFNSAQIFPSCTWTPEGLAAFVRHLGPEMAARDVEVYLGTLERADDSLVERVLADPDAARHITGIGAQWAGKGAVPYLHRHHPELTIYQTEQECGDGENDWRLARYAWNLMRHFFSHGATAYMYWNMSLLRGGISRWGWAQNSLVTVDAETGTYEFTHEFFMLQHVSHFVQSGARRIPTLSYTGHDNQLVFRNPDGSLVVVVQNDLAEDTEVSFFIEGRALAVTLPADSLSTLVVPAG